MIMYIIQEKVIICEKEYWVDMPSKYDSYKNAEYNIEECTVDTARENLRIVAYGSVTENEFNSKSKDKNYTDTKGKIRLGYIKRR